MFTTYGVHFFHSGDTHGAVLSLHICSGARGGVSAFAFLPPCLYFTFSFWYLPEISPVFFGFYYYKDGLIQFLGEALLSLLGYLYSACFVLQRFHLMSLGPGLSMCTLWAFTLSMGSSVASL